MRRAVPKGAALFVDFGTACGDTPFMAVPTPPIAFKDYGSVADTAAFFEDWGSVAAAAVHFVDWENILGVITSTGQIKKPVDKLWAFIGDMERRKDLING